MPIYEYQAVDPKDACHQCRHGFEILQQINETPLLTCTFCNQQVKKIISWCHSAVMERSEEQTRVENQVKDYENSGRWSHAAELADKHSEKTKDKGLKVRALENYKKAGYDPGFLSKHAKLNDD